MHAHARLELHVHVLSAVERPLKSLHVCFHERAGSVQGALYSAASKGEGDAGISGPPQHPPEKPAREWDSASSLSQQQLQLLWPQFARIILFVLKTCLCRGVGGLCVSQKRFLSTIDKQNVFWCNYGDPVTI